MGLDAPIPEWAVYDGGPPTCDTYLGGESPLHEVFVSTFRLAVNETTVQCYAECVGRGECEAPACDDLPPDYLHVEDHNHEPVLCLSRADAEAYCRFRQGRLPTEAEWEKAARGSEALPYPAGAEVTCDVADVGRRNDSQTCWTSEGDPRFPLAASERPLDLSPFGIQGMSGGVREWVSDRFHLQYYQIGGPPWRDPQGPEEAPCEAFADTVRGGSFEMDLGAPALFAYSRAAAPAGAYLREAGVRCAWDK